MSRDVHDNVDSLRCGQKVIDNWIGVGCSRQRILRCEICPSIHDCFDAAVAAVIILLVWCSSIMISAITKSISCWHKLHGH